MIDYDLLLRYVTYGRKQSFVNKTNALAVFYIVLMTGFSAFLYDYIKKGHNLLVLNTQIMLMVIVIFLGVFIFLVRGFFSGLRNKSEELHVKNNIVSPELIVMNVIEVRGYFKRLTDLNYATIERDTGRKYMLSQKSLEKLNMLSKGETLKADDIIKISGDVKATKRQIKDVIYEELNNLKLLKIS